MKPGVLDTTSTEKLIAALLNRFDYAVFVGEEVGSLKGGHSRVRVRWGGNVMVCVGLCQHASHVMLSSDDMADVENDDIAEP